MSAIFDFDFQEKKTITFSEENYLNYTKMTQFVHVTIAFSPKQGQTRTSRGPIWVPLI